MTTQIQTTNRNPKLPTNERWLRAGVSRGISEGVDRKVGIIRGFSVITKGEARGHGMSIDDMTLDQVVEHGNASQLGMKSRFGHPSMSSDALGTFLGRTTNFRRDGDRVRADLQLDESAFRTPKGNLADYVLKLAETDPGAFASSIVFVPGEREVEDEDDSNALPLARVEKLLAVDVVDEGAANEGMFGYTGQVELSAAATRALDELLLRPDAIEKIIGFLERFSSSRESQVLEEEKELLMADPKSVSEDLEKVRNEAFAAGRAEGDKLAASSKEGAETARKAERERILSIRKSAFSGQEDLVNKAIEEGWTKEQALEAFIDAEKLSKKGRLEEVRKDTVPALGASPNSTLPKTDPCVQEPEPGVEYDEARYSAQFDASKNIQVEFGNNKAAYLSFCRNMCRGGVKLARR